MIIGIVSPDSKDCELFSTLLLEGGVETVDSTDVVRSMDRASVNRIISKDTYKKDFLKQIEEGYGVVAVSGNVVLNQPICKWLLETGNVVCMVYRDNLDDYDSDVRANQETYFGDPDVQQYEMVDKYKSQYEGLSGAGGSLFHIDLSDEDCPDLIELVEMLPELVESCVVDEPEEVVEPEGLEEGKEPNMEIEDSIRAAMRELGVVFDEPEATDEVIQDDDVVEIVEEAPEAEEVIEVAEETFEPEPEVEEVVEETPEETYGDEEPEVELEENEFNEYVSVFVKLSKSTMALMIPSDVEFEEKTIGGVGFKVATVIVPDMDSKLLQQLPVVKRYTPTKQGSNSSDKAKN